MDDKDKYALQIAGFEGVLVVELTNLTRVIKLDQSMQVLINYVQNEFYITYLISHNT